VDSAVRSRKGTILMLALSGSLVMVGCSAETRQKILPIFFDGVPKEGESAAPPPTHRVRRDLLREIEDLKRKLDEAEAIIKAGQKAAPLEAPHLPAEKARTWEEAMEALPKDGAGSVDWVQALKADAIAPRPGLDPKAPEQATLDLDVELTSPSRFFSAKYPHSAHTQWLTCGNCHPAIFPLSGRVEPTVITMAKIRGGDQCGVCHGKVAFPVENECARCHTKIPAQSNWHPSEEPRKPIERARAWDEAAKLLPVTAGEPDWVRALAEGVIAPRPGVDPNAPDQPVFPITVERVPKDQPMFKAIFPHEAHTAWLGCTNCHPAPFQMQRGTTPINMGLIFAGQACGACHGKVAFPPTACGRCHPAMAGG
jgi:c(7)-type cytochrome triheme protein